MVPAPFFQGPQCGSIDPVNADRSIPFPPLTGSRVNQREALRPGGDFHPETIELLRAEKVHPATVRAFAHLDPAYIREQIDAAWRCGRGREMPNFLVGCLKTGGVYGSSWTGNAQPAKEAPTVPLDPPPAPPLPTYCPTCGKVCPASHEGHCTRCEPELFDPPAGGAP